MASKLFDVCENNLNKYFYASKTSCVGSFQGSISFLYAWISRARSDCIKPSYGLHKNRPLRMSVRQAGVSPLKRS